jgi:hypothetical protein
VANADRNEIPGIGGLIRVDSGSDASSCRQPVRSALGGLIRVDIESDGTTWLTFRLVVVESLPRNGIGRESLFRAAFMEI